MEEEIKHEEFEKITGEISGRLANDPWTQKAREIFERGGGTLLGGGGEIDAGEFCIENGKKYFKFYENYKATHSKKEIETITNILKNEGYELK